MTPILTYRNKPLYHSLHTSPEVKAIYDKIALRRSMVVGWDRGDGLARSNDRAQVEIGLRLGDLLSYDQLLREFGATQICVSR